MLTKLIIMIAMKIAVTEILTKTITLGDNKMNRSLVKNTNTNKNNNEIKIVIFCYIQFIFP